MHQTLRSTAIVLLGIFLHVASPAEAQSVKPDGIVELDSKGTKYGLKYNGALYSLAQLGKVRETKGFFDNEKSFEGYFIGVTQDKSDTILFKGKVSADGSLDATPVISDVFLSRPDGTIARYSSKGTLLTNALSYGEALKSAIPGQGATKAPAAAIAPETFGKGQYASDAFLTAFFTGVFADTKRLGDLQKAGKLAAGEFDKKFIEAIIGRMSAGMKATPELMRSNFMIIGQALDAAKAKGKTEFGTRLALSLDFMRIARLAAEDPNTPMSTSETTALEKLGICAAVAHVKSGNTNGCALGPTTPP